MGKLLVSDGVLMKGISVSVPARVALAGNPSDLGQPAGIGAVLSLAARRFKATVTLAPSNYFRIVGPEIAAPTCLDAIENIEREGFTNWDTLARATLRSMRQFLVAKGQILAANTLKFPCTMTLETDIPRQRGMSNSSGWIIGILQAYLIALGLQSRYSVQEMAEFALGVEKILGISAGLQDRLLQCTALNPKKVGVLMDFSHQRVECSPIRFDEQDLPRMALLLSDEPSHSGKVHEWAVEAIARKEEKILDDMSELAQLALRAHSAIEGKDQTLLGELMDATKDKRIEVYGHERLGEANMQLVEICERAGCPANFTGSGGAMVCLLPRMDSLARLQSANRTIAKGRFEIYPLN